MPDRPLIAITAGAANLRRPSTLDPVTAAAERADAEPWMLAPDDYSPDDTLARANALVIVGDENAGPLDGGRNGHLGAELALVNAALDADMPIYGIGRGIQILNAALGGGQPRHVQGHDDGLTEDGERSPAYHHIYISPGSKLAAVVGSGGFVRVNSLHERAIREAQKSPRLLASAYSLEDGIIEALESPNHRWVIAVQFHPERRMELPPHFDRLFQSLSERAAERASAIP